MVTIKVLRDIPKLHFKLGETRVVSNTFYSVLATQYPEFIEQTATAKMGFCDDKMLTTLNYEIKGA